MPIMNSGRLIPASSASSGSSESGISSLMFPLNSVVSCNWDSVNNKPDILEIDSVDDSKVNLKATAFPIQLNFANGLDDDGRPQGLVKSISSDQILNLSSYAGKTVQIIASCADVDSDPIVEIAQIYDPLAWTEANEVDILPAMTSNSQDGYITTASSASADAFRAFSDNTVWGWESSGEWDIGWVQIELPNPTILTKVKAYLPSGNYIQKVQGSNNGVDYTDLWTGSQGGTTTVDVSQAATFSIYRFTIANEGHLVEVYDIELWEAPTNKYSRSDNQVKTWGDTNILAINLGYAIVGATGSVSTLGDYIDLTPNAPGGMNTE